MIIYKDNFCTTIKMTEKNCNEFDKDKSRRKHSNVTNTSDDDYCCNRNDQHDYKFNLKISQLVKEKYEIMMREEIDKKIEESKIKVKEDIDKKYSKKSATITKEKYNKKIKKIKKEIIESVKDDFLKNKKKIIDAIKPQIIEKYESEMHEIHEKETSRIFYERQKEKDLAEKAKQKIEEKNKQKKEKEDLRKHIRKEQEKLRKEQEQYVKEQREKYEKQRKNKEYQYYSNGKNYEKEERENKKCKIPQKDTSSYDTLGLNIHATQKEIRMRYLQICLKIHPDKAKTIEEEKIFTEIFQKINNAYTQIC